MEDDCTGMCSGSNSIGGFDHFDLQVGAGCQMMIGGDEDEAELAGIGCDVRLVDDEGPAADAVDADGGEPGRVAGESRVGGREGENEGSAVGWEGREDILEQRLDRGRDRGAGHAENLPARDVEVGVALSGGARNWYGL